jgi:hypothetical protein
MQVNRSLAASGRLRSHLIRPQPTEDVRLLVVTAGYVDSTADLLHVGILNQEKVKEIARQTREELKGR